MSKSQRDYTQQATELFGRFADRHGLRYEIGSDAPVEVWWSFPRQDKLSEELTLALQNNDELNFGVGKFWSYFFPFDSVCSDFEALLDDWIAGQARIQDYAFGTSVLEHRRDGSWLEIYSAHSLWPFRGRLVRTLQNRAA
ncbi:hypothetical protein [Caulobacter sp. DWR1-3-2b1]|uniref:hypothetical protein n=1 Tax=Caulobacter sp. DWR1-3-2b1 TaxID=2804670 RepID=UPI003CF5D7BE